MAELRVLVVAHVNTLCMVPVEAGFAVDSSLTGPNHTGAEATRVVRTWARVKFNASKMMQREKKDERW